MRRAPVWRAAGTGRAKKKDAGDGGKPDSVLDGHLSKRPEPGTPMPRAAASSPIWPCFGRGLPCRLDRSKARWALTPPFHPYPARGGMFSVALSFPGRIVPGIPRERDSLPCEVRTFLPGTPKRPARPSSITDMGNLQPLFLYSRGKSAESDGACVSGLC